jgi:hypothetical protein
MSAATFLKSLLGEIAPKAAAPAAGAGLMFPSDDAEAGVGGVIKNADKLVAELNRMVKGGMGERNAIAAIEKVMHNKELTNYDEMGDYAITIDGDTAGPYWKGEVRTMISGLKEHPHLRKDALDQLNLWEKDHMGRELGWRAPRRDPNKKHKPQPLAAPNSAMGDALKLAMAGGAAGGAGGAGASEAGFPEWSRYEIGPSHGLPTPTWGDVGESLFNVLGAPMAGLQGLARGAYGLATGEDVVTAGAEAAHMMGSEYKGEGGLMTPGFDTAEGWKRYGDFTEESFNKSGAVSPGVAKALGIVNRAPEYIIPF